MDRRTFLFLSAISGASPLSFAKVTPDPEIYFIHSKNVPIDFIERLSKEFYEGSTFQSFSSFLDKGLVFSMRSFNFEEWSKKVGSTFEKNKFENPDPQNKSRQKFFDRANRDLYTHIMNYHAPLDKIRVDHFKKTETYYQYS